MVDIVGFTNSLLTATFGGVPFSVIDTRQEVGRRTQRFVFPGIDDASYQDLGADDGPITIRGLLYGDDYITQAQALMAVFRSPGPYTLVHPWFRTQQVILVPGQRPNLTLTASELLIARFEVSVYPFNPSAQANLDTLSQLQTQLTTVSADAQSWMANVLAPTTGVLNTLSFAQGWLTNIGTVFQNAISTTASSPQIISSALGTITSLGSVTIASIASAPAEAAASLAGIVTAVTGCAAPPVPSAVAPGGVTTAATPAVPADVVSVLLSTVQPINLASGSVTPGPALGAALQAMVVAGAVQAANSINYTSQQDALAQAAVLYAAIDAATTAAALAAQTDPTNAAPVWGDLIGLKAALAADMSTLVGRLPPVVMIKIPSVMPAWLIAQYISGDTPSEVFGTYQDIIARNNVYHPALVQPGQIEVLDV